MSAPTTCSNCRAVLPGTVRFCPECGARVGGAAHGPPIRTFNVAPPALLLGLAVVILLLGVVLLALQHWLIGVVLLALGAVLSAMYAGAFSGSHGAGRRVSALRTRSRAVVEAMNAQAQARRTQLALRLEVEQLYGERGGRLRELGEAVYGADAAGTEAARAAVAQLDGRIAEKEEQMTHVALQAQERVEQVRAQSRPTELLEPPVPVPVPEPYPPPDEGTPPTPTPVPEPYPPPDEGDPPQPR
jgi:hypothetical protein